MPDKRDDVMTERDDPRLKYYAQLPHITVQEWPEVSMCVMVIVDEDSSQNCAMLCGRIYTSGVLRETIRLLDEMRVQLEGLLPAREAAEKAEREKTAS